MIDIEFLLTIHAISFMSAVIGFIYSDVLTEPDMIFHKLFKGLESWLSPEFDFIFKPLIGCFRCVSGQIALWLFIIFLGSSYISNEMIVILKVCLIHIYTICLTIYISWILSKIYRN